MKGLLIDCDKTESVEIHRPVKRVGEINGWAKYVQLPITNIEIVHRNDNEEIIPLIEGGKDESE